MNEQPQGAQRTKAIHEHVLRVIKIFRRHNPSKNVPRALRDLSERKDPECHCKHPLPQSRFGTYLCSSCGSVAVPDRPPRADEFPRDALGNFPAALRMGQPITCRTCAHGFPKRVVYLRFAESIKKLWCPRCHPTPRSESYTAKLLRRGRAQA